jgi:hypothetical protein
LFDFRTAGKETGLEKILAKWGIEVAPSWIKDPGNSSDEKKAVDVIVGAFGNHPVVNPLVGADLRLELYEPRSIAKIKIREQAADAPRTEEIAFTGTDAFAQGDEAHKKRFPLMAAAEKGDLKGIMTGSTRIVVAGDSFFLANQMFDLAANRDFVGYTVNWLLDRAQLLEGVGARPISHYRLIITRAQLTNAEWILLGGMPGTALLVGGLVWLRRRK